MMKSNKATMQDVTLAKERFQPASSHLKSIVLQAIMMGHKNQPYFVRIVK
jgi:hypothetical protein